MWPALLAPATPAPEPDLPRRRVEQRLQHSIASAESERQRWARELHDETLQGMAALKLALTWAMRAGPHGTRPVLACAIDQLDANIAGLRAIITDLRPAALDQLGLEPALRALVDGVAERGSMTTKLEIDLGEVRIHPDVETTAYRIAQEALTNVLKHAAASRVELSARRVDSGVRVRVVDDGVGIKARPSAGYGLIGMRERAQLAGGWLEISAAAGGGTSVEAQLPL